MSWRTLGGKFQKFEKDKDAKYYHRNDQPRKQSEASQNEIAI
jgi:hypothetical protein